MNKKVSTLTFAILAIFLLVGLAFTEGYRREFKPNELDLVKGAVDVEDGQETAGLFSQGPGVNLPKGTYQFKLCYTAQAEDSSVAVYTDETGDTPVYTHPLPVALEKGEWTFDCHFDQNATNLQIAVNYSGNGAFSVEKMSIRSQGPVCTDVFAISLFLLALIGGYLYIRKCQPETKEFLCPSNIYLFLTLAALGVSIPLLNDYVMGGGDVAYHLNRIEGIRTGLLSGQFPVRVHSGTLWGYGYGSSLFYPELLLYFPALLRLCGVSLVTATKIYLISMNLLAGWLMYLAASRILDSSIRGQQSVQEPQQPQTASRNAQLAGLAAALFFLTAIFRLGEGYIDAAYGQFSSMSFMPLLLLGVYELLFGDERRWGYAVAGFTLVFQSHILSAVWSALLILTAALLSIRHLCEKSRLPACIKAAGLTILLNLWYLLPMLYMMREPIQLNTLPTPFTEYAVPFALLFKASPEIGFSTTKDGLSLDSNILPLTIGLSLLFSNLLLALPKCQGYRKARVFDGMRKKARRLFVWGAVMVFMASRAMPWKLLARISAVDRLTGFTQFPWRLLAFAVTFLSISGAAALVITARETGQQAMIFALAFAVALFPMTTFLDAKNPEHIQIREVEIIGSELVAGGEYLYHDTDISQLPRRTTGPAAVSEQLEINDFQRKNGHVTFRYTISGSKPEQNSPLYADMPLLYYPGYRAWVDGLEIPVERSGQNLVRIILPAGSQGTVEVCYKGKRSWNLATMISAASIAGWGIWGIYTTIKRKRR